MYKVEFLVQPSNEYNKFLEYLEMHKMLVPGRGGNYCYSTQPSISSPRKIAVHFDVMCKEEDLTLMKLLFPRMIIVK